MLASYLAETSDDCKQLNTLVEILRAEIFRATAIPFHRFMELALHHPEHGYYERDHRQVGRRGDFYTSVSVGGLFGELLAFQFAGWHAEMWRAGGRWRIVEAGAHDGRLAADMLGWLRANRPALFAQLDYCLIEPSARRRQWQQETLAEFAARLHWFGSVTECAAVTPQFTIVFANELLDAFPVHRRGWDAAAKRWFEWGVAWRDDHFIWTRLPVTADHAELLAPSALESVLPDGFTIEVCPAAEQWWAGAARALTHGQGKLLTFDYGLTAEEFFMPQRSAGTLRAYRRHRVNSDLLAAPGEQDLTAHVNFTALQAAGEAAGLHTTGLISQAQFLTRIARHAMQPDARFGDWPPARVRQFQTLTHPEHLGRPFKVLLQSTPS